MIRSRNILARLLTLAAILALPRAAAAQDLFTPPSGPARSAIVTAPWADPPAADPPDSRMLREIAGIAAVLDARDIRSLNRAIADQTRIREETRITETLWALHITGPTDARTVRIGRVAEGWLLAESDEARARLEESTLARLTEDWIAPRPDPAALDAVPRAPQHESIPAPPIEGPAADLAPPVWLNPIPRPSPTRLDSAALAERFSRGRPAPFAEPITRNIDDESFLLRLPLGHDPARPVPLLVWIGPGEEAMLPTQITEAADTLGIALITPAKAGNDRPVVDRMQLALDAVRTSRSVLWTDKGTVIIAGFSGGGRLASMLWAGAPDIFTAALCIGGVNTHHDIPTGEGGVWPHSHDLPLGDQGRALRDHPIAVISGPRDFNFHEARERVDRLARENFEARFFDVPRLTHTMPTKEPIIRALTWLDTPLAQGSEAVVRQAEATLDSIIEEADREARRNRTGMQGELSDRHRRTLERLTILAPWTEPAWEAAELLGYDSASSP